MTIVPWWVKYLASEFARRSDIISKIRITRNKIRIKYKTNITEHYYYRDYKQLNVRKHLLSQNDINFSDIAVCYPYETNPLDVESGQALSYHFKINRGDFDAASLPSKRIAIHRALLRLMNAEVLEHSYPSDVLKRDWESMLGFKAGKYITGNAFNMYPLVHKDCPWKRIIDHFFTVQRSLDANSYFYALNMAAKCSYAAFTTAEINKRADWVRARKVYSPLAYAAILKRFNHANGIIDTNPSIGSKAVAAALLGIKYYAPRCQAIDNAISRGFCELTGFQYEELNNQNASVIINDNEFKNFDIESTKPYLGLANTLIAFAKHSERTDVQAKYNPRKAIKIYSDPLNGKSLKEHNYLMIW